MGCFVNSLSTSTARTIIGDSIRGFGLRGELFERHIYEICSTPFYNHTNSHEPIQIDLYALLTNGINVHPLYLYI